MSERTTVTHLFSVDVEEYFQVNAFEGVVERERWLEYPSRVHASLELIIEALAEADASGTFFTLGWLAKQRPELVRRISEAGHEVASHGFWHRRVTTLSPEEFRADVRETKSVLEDICGQPVLGFRAPSFSILPGMEWAFQILLEEGYRYDSSRFPIRRPGYGSPGTPKDPHWINSEAGRVFEIPMATARIGGMAIPAAGGGYMRQFPYGLIRLAFNQASAAGVPAMFYLHPWEVDPEQPRLPVPLVTRFRHYRGLSKTLPVLKRLLSDFRFSSVARQFPALANPTGTDPE